MAGQGRGPALHRQASPEQTLLRERIWRAAIELFTEQGFETTSVDEIARAAGISRSRFFRQFRSKEDVVFADHETLLEHARQYLEQGEHGEQGQQSEHGQGHSDPWEAVCRAALMVFDHFADEPGPARRRYRLLQEVPALRERELITSFRYDRLFSQYLREAVPGVSALRAVQFASLVTTTHNAMLREVLRDPDAAPRDAVVAELDGVRRLFGVHGPRRMSGMNSLHGAGRDGSEGRSEGVQEDLVVAVFPRSLPPQELARRIGHRLEDAAHEPR